MTLLDIILLGLLVNICFSLLTIITIFLLYILTINMESKAYLFIAIDNFRFISTKTPSTHKIKQYIIFLMPFAKVLDFVDFINNLSKAHYNLSLYLNNFSEYLMAKYDIELKE